MARQANYSGLKFYIAKLQISATSKFFPSKIRFITNINAHHTCQKVLNFGSMVSDIIVC